MNKFLLTLALVLSATFVFSQAAPLQVWNFTSQPMYIWAGAADGCNGIGATSTPQLVDVGNSATINPVSLPTDSWVGFKTTASLLGGNVFGKFHSPCLSCGYIDVSSNVTVTWDIVNGCFRARITD